MPRPWSLGPSGPCDFIHTDPLSEHSGFLPSPSLPGNQSHISPHFWGTLQVGLWKPYSSTEGKGDENSFCQTFVILPGLQSLGRDLTSCWNKPEHLFSCWGVGLRHPAFLRHQATVPQARRRWQAEWRGEVAESMLCYLTAPGVETGLTTPAVWRGAGCLPRKPRLPLGK